MGAKIMKTAHLAPCSLVLREPAGNLDKLLALFAARRASGIDYETTCAGSFNGNSHYWLAVHVWDRKQKRG